MQSQQIAQQQQHHQQQQQQQLPQHPSHQHTHQQQFQNTSGRNKEFTYKKRISVSSSKCKGKLVFCSTFNCCSRVFF